MTATGVSSPLSGRNHVRAGSIALGLAWILLVYAWVMNAWLGDDAFITFRTAQNLAEGFGLRWNPGERVQTYTHPLWMLLVSLCFRITGEFYFTVLALQAALTLGAICVVTRGLDPDRSTLATCALLTSKAFIDYTSSGLENPLGYVLLAAFVASRGATQRTALGGAIFLTRADLILLVFPGLVYSVWTERRSVRIPRMLAALAPVAAWAVFAVFYYGFLFPNTAYAKLGTGIPASELVPHGAWYFANSLEWDTPTLPLLAAGMMIALISKAPEAVANTLGVAAYLLYILWIGGDFMTGRYFAAPLLFIAATAVRALPRAPKAALSLTAAIAVTLLAPLAPLKTTREYRGHLLGWDHGIVDERGLYWRKDTGLIFWGMRGPLPIHPNIDYARELKARSETVVVESVVGLLGWAAGRDLTIIDPLALGDPLLARLPVGPRDVWGIGHFPRRLPPGYEASVRSGRNEIRDPGLRLYYDKLHLITSGPLFSRDRLNAIFQMNAGRYDRLLRPYIDGLPPRS